MPSEVLTLAFWFCIKVRSRSVFAPRSASSLLLPFEGVDAEFYPDFKERMKDRARQESAINYNYPASSWFAVVRRGGVCGKRLYAIADISKPQTYGWTSIRWQYLIDAQNNNSLIFLQVRGLWWKGDENAITFRWVTRVCPSGLEARSAIALSQAETRSKYDRPLSVNPYLWLPFFGSIKCKRRGLGSHYLQTACKHTPKN